MDPVTYNPEIIRVALVCKVSLLYVLDYWPDTREFLHTLMNFEIVDETVVFNLNIVVEGEHVKRPG